MSFCRRSSCSVCQPCWRTASLQLQASQQLFHAGSIASVWAPSAILCDSHEDGHCSAWRQSLPSCCSRAFSRENVSPAEGRKLRPKLYGMAHRLSQVFSPRISCSGKSKSKPHACSVYAHDTHTHVIGSVRPRSPRIFICGRCMCAIIGVCAECRTEKNERETQTSKRHML